MCQNEYVLKFFFKTKQLINCVNEHKIFGTKVIKEQKKKQLSQRIL